MSELRSSETRREKSREANPVSSTVARLLPRLVGPATQCFPSHTVLSYRDSWRLFLRFVQREQQEVNGRARRMDETSVRVDLAGVIGWLEMTAQPLFQFGTVPLNPTPDRRVVLIQTTLGQQLFNIAEWKRCSSIAIASPEDTSAPRKESVWRRLPPSEEGRCFGPQGRPWSDQFGTLALPTHSQRESRRLAGLSSNEALE